MAVDYSSWKFTQKVIRIYHNRAVQKHFKTEADSTPRNGKDAIKASVLIRASDSALEVMNKQLLFQRISEESKALFSYPESWMTKSIGADIPQLKIIYRIAATTRTGNYDICIPHYNGSKDIKPPKYTKGNQPVIFNLKDRSKIVINASSEKEGISVINYFLKFVDQRYIDRADNFVLGAKSRVKKQSMRPVRADFYPNGQGVITPSWRIYF